jgi:hypothetical protein
MQPIPANRPVIGQDLDDLRQSLGLSVADALWVYGNISMNDWSATVRGTNRNPDKPQSPQDPLKDPTLALLVRLLDRYRNELPILPPAPSAEEIFALFGSAIDVNKRSMSILLGSEETAMYRWVELGMRQPPIVQRLMYFLQLMFLRNPDPVKRANFAQEWRETVLAEAKARGVDNIFSIGTWSAETALVKGAKIKKGQSERKAQKSTDKTTKKRKGDVQDPATDETARKAENEEESETRRQQALLGASEPTPGKS